MNWSQLQQPFLWLPNGRDYVNGQIIRRLHDNIAYGWPLTSGPSDADCEGKIISYLIKPVSESTRYTCIPF